MISVSNHSPLGEPGQKFSAIILAAGYSSRMGEFKPLLRVGSCSAVETVVRLFLNAGIDDVSVVVGHRARALSPVVEAAGARCVTNNEYDLGMYSSVRAGVAALPSGTEACFIIPADIPLIRVSTIRRLGLAYLEHAKAIVYPLFEGLRGHPPLISRTVLAEILQAGPDGRLSRLLSAHEAAASDIFVPDEGICRDMDTPDELVGIVELARHREIPTPRECEALLAEYQPENRVVRHSRVVADVAYRIAKPLAARGVSINPDLTRAGGLLHDIAKGRKNHALAGAQLLQDFAFDNVAAVIAEHTDCAFDGRKLNEAAIVYLADKLVAGERVVGLAQRFHRSLDRFRENPIALAAALRRRTTAEAILHETEGCLGVELQHVIGEIVGWQESG
jgi:molybdenum cofactor cytidylyltransferase